MHNFIHNHSTNLEENRQIEFKEITPENKNPVETIKKQAPEYVVAFLNDLHSTGGKIFWGIRNSDRAITGVHLDYQMRDKVKINVHVQLSQITPSLAPNAYEIEFHEIFDNTGKTINDLWIIELSVAAPTTESIHFAGGKRAFVKTDSGRKELSGLELTDEIKRREGILSNQKPVIEIEDFFSILKDVKPVLYWIDKTISKKETKNYFSALQNLFNGHSTLFEGIDRNLLFGTDNLLRILSTLPKFDGYTHNKTAIAYKEYFIYIIHKNRKLKHHYIENANIQENVLFIKSTFNDLLKHTDNIDFEERLLVYFILSLLSYYFNFIKSQKSKKILIVNNNITESFINFIIPLIRVKMGLKFPDKSMLSYYQIIDEIRNYCESDWLQFLKEQKM